MEIYISKEFIKINFVKITGLLSLVLALTACYSVASRSGSGRERGLDTPLYRAVAAGDLESVNAILDDGADSRINESDSDAYPYYATALARAVADDNASIVRSLLENGADPNRADNLLRTSAVGMISFADNESNGAAILEIYRLLVEYGGNPNAGSAARALGALDTLFSAEILTSGQKIDLVNWLVANDVPLLTSSYAVSDDMTQREFESNGFNPLDADTLGVTMAHIYAFDGDAEALVAYIAQGGSVNSQDEGGYSPLFYALFHGVPGIAHAALIQPGDGELRSGARGPDITYSPEGVTNIRTRRQNVVTLLIESGADVGLVDKNGYTVLHLAALRNQGVSAQLILERSPMLRNVENDFGEVAADLAFTDDLRSFLQ